MYTIGISGGANAIFGDFPPSDNVSSAYGILFQVNPLPWFNIKTSLLKGNFTGTEFAGALVRRTMNSDFYEFGVTANLNIMSIITTSSKRLIEPYFSFGAAYMQYNEMVLWGDGAPWFGIPGTPDNTCIPAHGKGNAMALKAGMGVDLNLSRKFTLFGEVNGNSAFSDGLDGHETYPYDLANNIFYNKVSGKFEPINATSAPGASGGNDFYYILQVGIKYHFTKKSKNTPRNMQPRKAIRDNYDCNNSHGVRRKYDPRDWKNRK